jgi:hypothetical protein
MSLAQVLQITPRPLSAHGEPSHAAHAHKDVMGPSPQGLSAQSMSSAPPWRSTQISSAPQVAKPRQSCSAHAASVTA